MSTSQEMTVMKMEVTPGYPAEQHIVCLCDSPPQQQQQQKKENRTFFNSALSSHLRKK